MTSSELATKKNTFITSFNTYKEKMTEITTKTDAVDKIINDSYDTELSKFLVNKNNEIKDQITAFCEEIEGKKDAIVTKVDNKITELRAEEDRAQQEAERKKQEAANTKKVTDTNPVMKSTTTDA